MVLLDLDSLVPPGWIPLVLVLLLLVTIGLLGLNMRKHLNRISAPVDAHHPESAPFSTDKQGRPTR